MKREGKETEAKGNHESQALESFLQQIKVGERARCRLKRAGVENLLTLAELSSDDLVDHVGLSPQQARKVIWGIQRTLKRAVMG